MPDAIPETICHCFNYTRSDIEQDLIRHGRSLILEKIMDAKRLGACRCATQNPGGT